MLDIAYLAEANITASEIETHRFWKKACSSNSLGNSFLCFMDLAWYNDIYVYWSIMYETHGT